MTNINHQPAINQPSANHPENLHSSRDFDCKILCQVCAHARLRCLDLALEDLSWAKQLQLLLRSRAFLSCNLTKLFEDVKTAEC